MDNENKNPFENEGTEITVPDSTPAQNEENSASAEETQPQPVGTPSSEEAKPAETPVAEETVKQQEIPTVQATPVNPPHTGGYAQPNPAGQGQYNPYGNQPPYNANHPPYNRNPYSNTPPNPNLYRPTSPYPVPPAPAPAKKSNNRGLKIFTTIVCILLVFSLILSGVLISKYSNKDSDFGGNSVNPGSPSDNVDKGDGPSLDIASTPAAIEGALTTAQIAEKVKPSIVGIVVYTNNSGSTAGEGTGVIMGENDTHTETYIVTCAHVISDAGIKVKVQTEDGTTYDAEIVGFDSRTDLGVVKIKAKGLPAAEFGNSDNLRVGDSVFAIGNPGGVEFFGSFTGGYVSAIDRPVSSDIGYTMKCIQHDAAINPGNSGGALVNVYGQVVGINSQKIAATDYEGMGFAIPITSAKTIIDNLINFGYVPNRPKLGITYYPVSASTQYSMIAQIQGLPAGTLIIDEIDSESSLANTEARRYDMIIAVNGKELTTADVLLELIDKGKVGDTMTLTLCRVNSNYTVNKFDVTITLVEDRSGSQPVETEPQYVDPFEYFEQFGY